MSDSLHGLLCNFIRGMTYCTSKLVTDNVLYDSPYGLLETKYDSHEKLLMKRCDSPQNLPKIKCDSPHGLLKTKYDSHENLLLTRCECAKNKVWLTSERIKNHVLLTSWSAGNLPLKISQSQACGRRKTTYVYFHGSFLQQ